MNNDILGENLINQLKYLFKYVKLVIFIICAIKFLNILTLNNKFNYNINNNIGNFNDYCVFSSIENISNIKDIYLTAFNINYHYSNETEIIEVIYFIKLNDKYNNIISPSDLTLIYNLHFLCFIYIDELRDNIYSFANINENQFFFCIEYINFTEKAKFGIKIYKINDINEKIESFDTIFFSEKLIKFNLNSLNQNNNIFNINYINSNYNKLLFRINKYKKKNIIFKKKFTLKSSFLKPPLCYYKKEITQNEGRWYYNNLYSNYFCFCKGDSCLDIKTFNNYNYQFCKYYFYLTIIDNNRNLYQKDHFLLSDFFDENIEPSDAFPIFKEMIKANLNAHYLTMSSDIYNQFKENNQNNYYDMPILYGIKIINGDILEKYLELLLKLKAVIAAEPYDCIDNLFYNIEYITYIFLGHGVQYIKSFLYDNYLSYKRFNKMVLPPYIKIVNTAIEKGWKKKNIIRIGLPKWDNYIIYDRNNSSLKNERNGERSIFLMFTWRKVKKGKKISHLYYKNLYSLLNNIEINEQLENQNIKLYYSFHHRLKEKIMIKNNNNIKCISQNYISTLLKNSSLIITDFSAIMFDAIIQKKPLILYIPDALDDKLKDLYIYDYYETINKLRNGIIDLYEIIFDLNKAINKIIYYIKNDFIVERGKLKFYNQFRFKNKGNTKKFIRYIKFIK